MTARARWDRKAVAFRSQNSVGIASSISRKARAIQLRYKRALSDSTHQRPRRFLSGDAKNARTVHPKLTNKLSRDRMQERSRSQLIRKTFELACIPDGMPSLVECTVEVAGPNNRGADAPSPTVEHEQPQEIGRKGSGKEQRSRRSGQHVKQWKRSSIGELILTNHQVELSPPNSAAGVVTKLCVFAPQFSVIQPPIQLRAALQVSAD